MVFGRAQRGPIDFKLLGFRVKLRVLHLHPTFQCILSPNSKSKSPSFNPSPSSTLSPYFQLGATLCVPSCPPVSTNPSN